MTTKTQKTWEFDLLPNYSVGRRSSGGPTPTLMRVHGTGDDERQAAINAILDANSVAIVWFAGGMGDYAKAVTVDSIDQASDILGGRGGWKAVCTVESDPSRRREEPRVRGNVEIWLGRGVQLKSV